VGSLQYALSVIGSVLSKPKYKIVCIVVAILFSLAYMVFTGIFIFTPRAIPEEFTVPLFRVGQIHTVYGDFPWIVAYLDRHTIFSMTMEAMILSSTISILVGINTALILYRFRSPKNLQSCKRSQTTVGFFGVVPAFLSIFACCGGGILVMILGGGILSALFPYGPLFGITSIGILVTGILLITKNIKIFQNSSDQKLFSRK